MQLSHRRRVVSAVFDEPNLVSAAGLVPIMKLAAEVGLRSLSDRLLTVPTDKGAHPGLKVSSLVAGMLTGADSIDDMAILRHGGMGRVFDAAYAPSTLGSFLRSFTFGHVRQLDAVACRVLVGLAAATPLLDGVDGDVLVDVDDSIIEVHGQAKQGAGFGYSGVRGINALISTITVTGRAPVIAASRLRKGSTGSPKGASRLVGDTLATLRRLRGKHPAGRVLLRADSAFYGHAVVHAAHLGGAQVSITVRQDPRVKAAIAAVPVDAWTTIQYTDAVFDEQSQRWISRAEVAEIDFTAFTSHPKAQQVPGPAGDPQDPGPERQGRRRRADPVRHLAVPRVLHHHPARAGRHGPGRPDPPPARHHRKRPRRPEALRSGALAIRTVHRQCCMVGVGVHRFQPHPRRSDHRARRTDTGHHRHDPPDPDQRPDPGLGHREHPDPAPADQLALAARMGSAVHPGLRPTTKMGPLTHPDNHPPAAPRINTTPPESRHTGRSTTPQKTKINLLLEGAPSDPGRWIQA